MGDPGRTSGGVALHPRWELVGDVGSQPPGPAGLEPGWGHEARAFTGPPEGSASGSV